MTLGRKRHTPDYFIPKLQQADGMLASPAMWHCPKCGKTIKAPFEVCWNCGTAQDGTQDPQFQPEPQDHFVADPTAASQGTSQPEELRREMKKAAGALLAVAILQTIASSIMLLMVDAGAKSHLLPANLEVRPAVIVWIVDVNGIFFTLYLWAGKNPFPATIVGLGEIRRSTCSHGSPRLRGVVTMPQ